MTGKSTKEKEMLNRKNGIASDVEPEYYSKFFLIFR